MITHKSTEEQIRSECFRVSTELEPFSSDARKCDFARAILQTGAAPLLKELSRLLSAPLDDITHDRKTLFMLINSRYLTKGLSYIIRNLNMLNDKVLLDAPYDAPFCTPDKYPQFILADVSSFYMWTMLRGATGADVRRCIDSKSAKNILAAEKQYGPHAFPTLIVRADIAMAALCEHVLIPAGRKLIKGQESVKINSIAAALSGLKK